MLVGYRATYEPVDERAEIEVSRHVLSPESAAPGLPGRRTVGLLLLLVAVSVIRLRVWARESLTGDDWGSARDWSVAR